MKVKWILPVVGALAVVATLGFVQQQDGGESQETEAAQGAEADTTIQPIAFPHDIHTGEENNNMDCQYCHYSAERSVSAGMPPVGTCMGCHQVVQGRNNPEEVNKIREYYQEGEAIPWVRVYKVADHVRFPHMRHVAAEVECQTCHGEVEEMGAIEEVNQPLSMGWCVSCHIEEGARRDCSVCHY